jgi:hypothetical protein
VATLRADGSPRVSGTEVQFHGPDLVAGAMTGALKSHDLRRDGRYALHSNPGDGSMDGGDAKVSGTAVEVVDPSVLVEYARAISRPPEPGASLDFDLFRFLITDVVRTSVHPDGDRLLIESWRPGTGLRTIERR